MARPRREDFAGAFHHVMNRGARRQPIFKLPDDCQTFLDILEDTAIRSGLEVHAYALMPNHYHLLVRSVRGNISDAMQYLNGRYTSGMNERHRWDGPLFRGRFRSQLVGDQSYLRMVLAYIHLNPLRARLVARLSSDAWTSHRAYVGLAPRPKWLTTAFFLSDLGGEKGVESFVRSVHCGATRYPEEFNLETGLFRTQTLELATWGGGRQKSRSRPGSRPICVDEVIAKVCRITGATEAELLKTTYGPAANPARRYAIWALHRGGMKQREIASRLRAPYYQVAKLLSRLQRERTNEPLRTWMREWTDVE